METIVVLDNIRSAHNVGAIFRTADGAGVSKIFLCGYTPAPIDRFGRVQPEIKKTALGATETVGWEAAENIVDVIGRLATDGYTIVAIEQDAQSTAYKEWQRPEKVAFVFGNEVDGVQQPALDHADAVLEIPMRGELARNRRLDDVGKESLNVSTTAGIILFHFNE